MRFPKVLFCCRLFVTCSFIILRFPCFRWLVLLPALSRPALCAPVFFQCPPLSRAPYSLALVRSPRVPPAGSSSVVLFYPFLPHSSPLPASLNLLFVIISPRFLAGAGQDSPSHQTALSPVDSYPPSFPLFFLCPAFPFAFMLPPRPSLLASLSATTRRPCLCFHSITTCMVCLIPSSFLNGPLQTLLHPARVSPLLLAQSPPRPLSPPPHPPFHSLSFPSTAALGL